MAALKKGQICSYVIMSKKSMLICYYVYKKTC